MLIFQGHPNSPSCGNELFSAPPHVPRILSRLKSHLANYTKREADRTYRTPGRDTKLHRVVAAFEMHPATLPKKTHQNYIK